MSFTSAVSPARRVAVAVVVAAVVYSASGPSRPAGAGDPPRQLPNVVLVLVDDLGYGDLGCYGAGKVATPRVDRLASEGVRFTDAHSSAPTCSPSRYGLLTGRYPWRRGRFDPGPRGPSVLTDELTLAELLRRAGYTTGCFGKWHLGFGRTGLDEGAAGTVRTGPREHGFDRSLVTAGSVVLHDGRVVAGATDAETLSIAEHETLVEEAALRFVAEQRQRPFFLYLPLLTIHEPHRLRPELGGSGGAGAYGDSVRAADRSVGRVLDTLDALELRERTLVLVTSDNGPLNDRAALAAGHRASGGWLGQKADYWEGGHRVPLVARWPGRIPAATRCDDLVSQVDLMATIAALVGVALPPTAAPDSLDLSSSLLMRPDRQPARREMVVAAAQGGLAMVRQGRWVLLTGQGSGGLTTAARELGAPSLAELGLSSTAWPEDEAARAALPPGQLFDLEADPGQSSNLYREHPELVQRLTQLLARQREAGGTRPEWVEPRRRSR